MESHSLARFSPQIYEQASEWLVEFRTGVPDGAAQRAFHAWLMESPAHVGAYLEVSALWNESTRAGGAYQVDELIVQAVAEPDNIVAHPRLSAASPTIQETQPRGKSRQLIMAVAASLLVVLGTAFAGWQHFFGGTTYVTGIGEQRSFALPDGSMVNLNARSTIRVRYRTDERLIELEAGQALFSVAKNAQRPFIVRAAATQVRAVGTQFDVYRKAEGTVVTVVEGSVAVTSSGAGGMVERLDAPSVTNAGSNEVLLSAGERVTVTRETLHKQTQLNTQVAIAWTQRQLVFESTPLAEVAEEFNRYNEQQLVVVDDEVQRFQIDGVFSSTDPASLLRFLRARPGIKVSESGSRILIETADDAVLR